MRIEWPEDMTVMVEVACGVLAGGLTAQQRTSLAERVGISEEVLLRYERARQACHDLIFTKQVNQAWSEAAHRMRELGKRMDDPAFPDELEKAVQRIRRATPENELKRERDEALAAVRAAIAASKETKESQGTTARETSPSPVLPSGFKVLSERTEVRSIPIQAQLAPREPPEPCPDRLPSAAAGDDGCGTDFGPRRLAHRQALEYATPWLPLGSEA